MEFKGGFHLTYTLPDNSKIAAVVPQYTKHGDQTSIYLTDGTHITTSLKVATIIRHLANRQIIDLSSLKNKTKQITKCTLWHPLVLAPDLVLVPIKMRKPKISGDATGGYINFHHIKTVHEAMNCTCIKLIGEHEVCALWKITTVHEHIQRAHFTFLATNKPNFTFESFAKYLLVNHLATL